MKIVWLLVLGLVLSLQDSEVYEKRRASMVELIERRGVDNELVIEALKEIQRHLFVREQYREQAYDDHPLPIEKSQTISQPYIVAAMTEAIDPKPDHKVLEIGTGSGYQAAVLAEIVKEVYTIEIIPELAASAEKLLNGLGYENINFKTGDGYQGWLENAPYDAIIVTAAPPYVPQALKDQLKIGGKLIIPVGPQGGIQSLKLLEKVPSGKFKSRELFLVRFVPMKKGK